MITYLVLLTTQFFIAMGMEFLRVPADGRCFFWCIMVHDLAEYDKKKWLCIERKEGGWPVNAERRQVEERTPLMHLRFKL